MTSNFTPRVFTFDRFELYHGDVREDDCLTAYLSDLGYEPGERIGRLVVSTADDDEITYSVTNTVIREDDLCFIDLTPVSYTDKTGRSLPDMLDDEPPMRLYND